MLRKTVRFLALTMALAASLASSVLGQQQLIHPTTHEWKYLAGLTDPGSPGWEATSFDDSAWPTGTGLFGVDSTAYPFPFVTPITAQNAGGPSTVYFRTRFNWSGSTAGVVLVGTNYIDDANVVYLNGVEIFRFNMPAFPEQVVYSTQGLNAAPAGYSEPVIAQIQLALDSLTNGNANPLVVGENVLSVEVHNVGTGSSDTVFTMALYAQQSTPPEFTTQPTNQTVTACRTVTLVAAATGIPNPTYSWTMDGVFIDPATVNATANSGTLVITNFQATDAGSYVCYAANSGGTVPSATAVLTYAPDNEPPVVTGLANVDVNTLLVTFDEPIDPNSLGDTVFVSFVALVSDPASRLDIDSVTVVDGSPSQLRVTTAEPRIPGLSYYLSLDSLADLCGPNYLTTATSNQIPNTVSFQEGVNGYVGTQDTDVRSTSADQIRGNDVQNLSDNNNPFAEALIRFDNIFGLNPGQIPFGASISSARLIFYTANNSPDTHGLYRMLTTWDESVTWNTTVNGIDVAGVEYLDPPDAQFVNQNTVGLYNTNDITESVRAWAAGVNNFGWTIRPIGGSDGYQFASSEAAAAEQRPLLIVDYVVLPNPITITQQPQSLTVDERQSATFNVVVTGSNPQFQWYKDNVLIPGATGPSHTIPSVVPSDAGSYTVAINNDIPSSANSDAAILTVTADTVAPTVVSALGSGASITTVVVTFSEAMAVGPAETASNYQLSGPGGITVVSAAATGNTVTLTLSGPLQFGSLYSLTVNDLVDTAATANVLSPNPTTVQVQTVLELVSVNGHVWRYLQLTADGAPAPCLDGAPWTEPGYDDSTWQIGSGVFYGLRNATQPYTATTTLNGSPVNTFLNVFTNGANALQETNYYYRTTFNLPLATTVGTRLLIHSMVDDGAVFYLNGNRVGDVRYTTPASCTSFASADGNQVWEPALASPGRVLDSTGLLPGVNTLAVQVAQINATSSDTTLGILLEAEIVAESVPPTVVSASGAGASITTVVVTFSEAMAVGPAETASNYQVTGPGGITVVSAVASGATVTLTLSAPLQFGALYDLTVKDVTDASFTPNVLSPNPTTVPVGTAFELVSINGQVWRYLQQTADGVPAPCLDGTSWTEPGYDDSAWQTGSGVFYGLRDPVQPYTATTTLGGSAVNTFLNVFTNGEPANALQATNYYFRTTFTIPSSTTSGLNLVIHSMVDDGAIFYLNGNRVGDVRYTADPASCTNFSSAGGSQTWEPALASPGRALASTGLMPGVNTLAVQVAQNNGTSSDITLGIQLAAESVAADAMLGSSFDGTTQTLTLSWDAAGFVLEAADAVSGPWLPVAGATSPWPVSTAVGSKFYRLVK